MDGMDGPGWMYRHGWASPAALPSFIISMIYTSPLHTASVARDEFGSAGLDTVQDWYIVDIRCSVRLRWHQGPLVQLSNPASAAPCPHVTDDKDIITGDKVATDYRAMCS